MDRRTSICNSNGSVVKRSFSPMTAFSSRVYFGSMTVMGLATFVLRFLGSAPVELRVVTITASVSVIVSRQSIVNPSVSRFVRFQTSCRKNDQSKLRMKKQAKRQVKVPRRTRPPDGQSAFVHAHIDRICEAQIGQEATFSAISAPITAEKQHFDCSRMKSVSSTEASCTPQGSL